MNEKIEQLAVHCWSNPIHKIGEFDKEQFANLIIKECIDLCDEIEDDYLKEFGDMDIAIGAGACAYKISAHFGVE